MIFVTILCIVWFVNKIIIECEYQQYFLPGDGAGHVGKRRRKEDTPEPEEADFKPFVPKKQTRKVERKLIPMIMKINPADLNESGIASRFNEIVDKIFEDMEMINLQELEANSIANDGNIEMPPEIIINKYNLRNLAEETAKLKSMGAMETISVERLIKLLTILELNIRDGSKVIPLGKWYFLKFCKNKFLDM